LIKSSHCIIIVIVSKQMLFFGTRYPGSTKTLTADKNTIPW